MYTFGENAEGQLGQGHFDACYTEPRVVKALAGVNIVQISASTGGAHTLFLDSCTPWSVEEGRTVNSDSDIWYVVFFVVIPTYTQ